MYHFDLTIDHVRVISQVLSTGPFNVVAPVIAELQQQINKQEQAAQAKLAEAA